MVDYKNFVIDNLPDRLEDLIALSLQIAENVVKKNTQYVYKPDGFVFHSGTQFTREGRCEINQIGCLVIHLLAKNYDLNNHYSPAFFNADIQKKLNNFQNELFKEIKRKKEE